MDLLHAALIVRDEAAHLDRCLTSLQGLVDRIVVVDTGSVDATVEIAQRHDALVDHVPWAGDFATPRNVSLDLVDAEWVLYIDADEAVISGDHTAFRAELARDRDHIGFRVPFVPRVGWTPYREYRLWRSRPTIRFSGAIHESIVSAVHATGTAENLVVGDATLLTIQHYGYEGDQSHKHARDEPMLLAQLEREPDRIYLYDHLARIYEAQGEAAAAREVWGRGIDQTRTHAVPGPEDNLVYINLIIHRLVAGAMGDDLAALVDEALLRFDASPPLEYAAAVVAFDQGDARGAEDRLDRLLALSPDEIIATNASYDGRLFGEWAWNLLGLCRFARGDDAGAAAAFAEAAAAAPHDRTYRARRLLAEARAVDPPR